MTDLRARFLSGDTWALGVCGSIEEVQVRVAQRINDKFGPDVIVMNEKCEPLVSNQTNSQDTLPPLVVVVMKPNARDDRQYKEKAVLSWEVASLELFVKRDIFRPKSSSKQNDTKRST